MSLLNKNDNIYKFEFLLLCLSVWLVFVFSVELTFELPDNAKQCFHEDVKQGIKSTVEFQVFINWSLI